MTNQKFILCAGPISLIREITSRLSLRPQVVTTVLLHPKLKLTFIRMLIAQAIPTAPTPTTLILLWA